MIRKIVLALITLFVLTWIVFAHFAKSKIVSFINNSQTDNIKISYSDASIAGFPFGWKVRFSSPKITLIDQTTSQEISSDYLNFSFNYKLENAKLSFGKVLYYSSASDEVPIEYRLQSQDDIVGFVDFTEALYNIDSSSSLKKIIQNVEFSNPYIVAFSNNGDELFNLSRLAIKLNSNIIDIIQKFSLKLSGNYKSSFHSRIVTNADCVLDTNYIISNNSDATTANNFDHKIELIQAKLNLDNASCDMKGFVALARNSLPQGKISVELVDYENLVDALLPDEFIFSKPYVKRFIAKAAAIEFSHEVTNKVNFDLEFSNKGISLGRVNLLEQKEN